MNYNKLSLESLKEIQKEVEKAIKSKTDPNLSDNTTDNCNYVLWDDIIFIDVDKASYIKQKLKTDDIAHIMAISKSSMPKGYKLVVDDNSFGVSVFLKRC